MSVKRCMVVLGIVGMLLMNGGIVRADCVSVGSDLSLNISCAENKGTVYGFVLKYTPNPADPFGFYWKMDLKTFSQKSLSTIPPDCVSIGNDLSLNISCAEAGGAQYRFVLNYILNYSDPFASYWKMDLSTFSENSELSYDEPLWITAGHISDPNCYLIAGANISVPLSDKVYSATTDDYGDYLLYIPQSVKFPNFFAGTVYKDGYLPNIIEFEYSDGKLYYYDSSPILQQSTEADIIFWKGLTVTHLGDDTYSGSANSQLQVPDSGLTFEESFTLSSQQISKYQYLTVSMYARGVQTGEDCDNKIVVENTKKIYPKTFSDTAEDGSFTAVSYRFDLKSLSPGATVLKIYSGGCLTGSDHDDFEVTNITGKLEQ